ncbi:MAG: DNA-directed RNA polymerase subunit N [archaeon]
MIIPIRCMSCGKPIAHLWEDFKNQVDKGNEVKKVMDDLGLEKYCCRAQFMGHVDLIEEVAKFKKA